MLQIVKLRPELFNALCLVSKDNDTVTNIMQGMDGHIMTHNVEDGEINSLSLYDSVGNSISLHRDESIELSDTEQEVEDMKHSIREAGRRYAHNA